MNPFKTFLLRILQINIDDNINFELINITDIRETDDYPGIRVGLKANYPPMSVPLFVDVTTGDKITPREIEYSLPLLFDNRSIHIMGYNCHFGRKTGNRIISQYCQYPT